MSEEVVLLNVDARGVATVTINRPAVNNAYNSAVIAGMTACVGAAAADPKVRVIVIRGNGRHFQAGADLKWLKEMGQLSPDENVAVSKATYDAVQGLTTVMKPTVA
ncbi:MAG: enoyl-CoA hydratase-related protein, partial [Pseudomonadota bacterium]|nr:enoyl-CoA hydratase-related protein [Pseudomonadota bacterium]